MLQKLVDALFRERHTTTITLTMPTKLYMALETYVYVRNETASEGAGELDREHVINSVVARYLAKALTKDQPKPPATLPVPSVPKDEYTQGRRQARSPSITHYNQSDQIYPQ